MHRTSSSLWLALALGLVVTGCNRDQFTPSDPAATPQNGLAADRESGDDGEEDLPFTYAVIGDFPYGAVKRSEMPFLVDLINADPDVERVLHAGDIKSGSNSDCSNAYFDDIRGQFDRFQDPLVYTPGDNEWTDCHVTFKNNGLYTPTERLARVRQVFFPVPGRTLGVNSRRVVSQAQVDPANGAYLENTMWKRSNVVFASINITGSDNDKAPWTSTPVQAGELRADFASYPSQAEEQASRTRATRAWIDRTFTLATREHAPAVVLLFQADMWDGTLANRTTTIDGYDDIVIQIGTLAAKFGRPVLLLMGDSHVFRVDQPYSPSSPLFELHPNTPVAPNVTRLVTNGSSSRTEYVRLVIDPRLARRGQTPWTFTEVPLIMPATAVALRSN